MENRTVGIAVGVLFFVTGLLMHIISFTTQVPPERRLLLRYSALAMIIVGGTMATLPFFAKVAQHQ